MGKRMGDGNSWVNTGGGRRNLGLCRQGKRGRVVWHSGGGGTFGQRPSSSSRWEQSPPKLSNKQVALHLGASATFFSQGQHQQQRSQQPARWCPLAGVRAGAADTRFAGQEGRGQTTVTHGMAGGKEWESVHAGTGRTHPREQQQQYGHGQLWWPEGQRTKANGEPAVTAPAAAAAANERGRGEMAGLELVGPSSTSYVGQQSHNNSLSNVFSIAASGCTEPSFSPDFPGRGIDSIGRNELSTRSATWRGDERPQFGSGARGASRQNGRDADQQTRNIEELARRAENHIRLPTKEQVCMSFPKNGDDELIIVHRRNRNV